MRNWSNYKRKKTNSFRCFHEILRQIDYLQHPLQT